MCRFIYLTSPREATFISRPAVEGGRATRRAVSDWDGTALAEGARREPGSAKVTSPYVRSRRASAAIYSPRHAKFVGEPADGFHRLAAIVARGEHASAPNVAGGGPRRRGCRTSPQSWRLADNCRRGDKAVLLSSVSLER
jgi:hypothetical protein